MNSLIWKLISYSEISLPLAPHEGDYIIGIVENENHLRNIVQIPINFHNHLEIGIVGNLDITKVQDTDVNLFIPNMENFEPLANYSLVHQRLS